MHLTVGSVKSLGWEDADMARRAPVQQRSIESMNRMLDAGEQLF